MFKKPIADKLNCRMSKWHKKFHNSHSFRIARNWVCVDMNAIWFLNQRKNVESRDVIEVHNWKLDEYCHSCRSLFVDWHSPSMQNAVRWRRFVSKLSIHSTQCMTYIAGDNDKVSSSLAWHDVIHIHSFLAVTTPGDVHRSLMICVWMSDDVHEWFHLKSNLIVFTRTESVGMGMQLNHSNSFYFCFKISNASTFQLLDHIQQLQISCARCAPCNVPTRIHLLFCMHLRSKLISELNQTLFFAVGLLFFCLQCRLPRATSERTSPPQRVGNVLCLLWRRISFICFRWAINCKWKRMHIQFLIHFLWPPNLYRNELCEKLWLKSKSSRWHWIEKSK